VRPAFYLIIRDPEYLAARISFAKVSLAMTKTSPSLVSGFAVTLLGCVLGSAVGSAQEKNLSGPQPGESISAFKVLKVSGPFDSQETQIGGGSKPTLLMFAHKVTEPAIGLMMSLEWYAAKHKDLNDEYVFLSDDRAETEARLRRWSQRPFLSKAHMSVSLDGQEGPGQYGLNRNVDMTVLVAKNGKVLNSFALLGPNNTDAQKILSAIAEVIGKERPSYDQIRAEMRAERDRRRVARRKESPVFKLAPDEVLGTLMLNMVHMEGATEERVQEASLKLIKWAGDDQDKRAALAKYCKALLNGNFEINRYARAALKQMSEIK